jgi:glucosamine--fructose-6-phosphate aminotransferase (isomerizing)
MCGIVAYVGHRQAHEVIIKGLKRLEYRGYDSTGIALLNGGLNVYKKKGKVSELENFVKGTKPKQHHWYGAHALGHAWRA